MRVITLDTFCRKNPGNRENTIPKEDTMTQTLLFSWHIHYNIQSLYASFHLRQSISPAPPKGQFLLANFSPNFSPNFSQKFDQKLTSNPEGSFYSIFCEKIVFINHSQISTLLIFMAAGIAGYTREEVASVQVNYAQTHGLCVRYKSAIRH